MLQVRYEQAVYGSFPFWDRGYGALANSPGCRPEWLAAFERACQRFGEPTPGSCPDGAVFALRLGRGPWAVVGVSSSGLDDRGRPGALAFHALFVAARDLMRCPRGPFDLVPALRKDWGPQTVLTGAMIEIDDISASAADVSAPVDEPGMGRAVRIVKALGSRTRRRVALESAAPLNDLACAVWLRAGDDLRKRLSIATLAYTNDNNFTLVTLPKLASAELGPDYLTPDQVDAIPIPVPTPVTAEAGTPIVGGQSRRPGPSSRKVAMIGAASVALVGIGLGSLAVSRGRERRTSSEGSVAPGRMVRAVAAPSRPSGPEIAGSAAHADEDIKARVAEGLLDLAERFDLADSVPPDAIASPTALMRHIATNLRYKGPWLTAEQRSRLRDDDGEEARRALEWDDHLSHFAAERPLPEGFDTGPLDWQLRTLSWSFGVAPHPDQVATELPFALAESLALPGGAARSLSLEAEYPALDPYARFLARLPRR